MFRRVRQGAVNVISGNSPLNQENAGYLLNAVEQCLADGSPRAVLDMQEVPLIDGAGLEKLLDIQDLFESRSGTLKIAGPNPLCRDILNVTGVANKFEIFRELKSAVGSFVH
jgi:anti-anti-sigma factor